MSTHTLPSSNSPFHFYVLFKNYLLNPVIAVHMCIGVGPSIGDVEGDPMASLFKSIQGSSYFTVLELLRLS